VTPLPPIAISVCIATHRRPERLAALLEDLRWQQLPPHEVVVVDNDSEGSAAAVVARARTHAPYPIRYAIEPLKNIAHARNRTVAMARGTWLAFIDDDERAGPGGWTRWRGPPCAMARTACSGRWNRSCRRARRMAAPWRSLRVRAPALGPARAVEPHALRQRAAERAAHPRPAAGVRPALRPHGGEDGDLLTRLAHAGARIVWCDEAPVHEPVEASRLSLRWLLLRALRGGQDFARHALAGRYGPPTATRRALLLLRALLQAGWRCSSRCSACPWGATTRRTGSPRPVPTSAR
jgi:succinoglycan biosynthesis protein ExoM